MNNASTKPDRESTPELDLRRPGILRVTRRHKGAERVTLRSVREALGRTQSDMARALETDQSEISRIERRPGIMLSTLRRYADALGLECEVALVFRDGRRVLLADPKAERPPK